MQIQQDQDNINESENNAADYQLWRVNRVLGFTGLSKSTLYDRISRGRFPSPISLDGRGVAWRACDVIKWAKTCIEQTKLEGRDAYLYPNNSKHLRKIKKKAEQEIETQR